VQKQKKLYPSSVSEADFVKAIAEMLQNEEDWPTNPYDCMIMSPKFREELNKALREEFERGDRSSTEPEAH
jgi:hypothetical protein